MDIEVVDAHAGHPHTRLLVGVKSVNYPHKMLMWGIQVGRYPHTSSQHAERIVYKQ